MMLYSYDDITQYNYANSLPITLMNKSIVAKDSASAANLLDVESSN